MHNWSIAVGALQRACHLNDTSSCQGEGQQCVAVGGSGEGQGRCLCRARHIRLPWTCLPVRWPGQNCQYTLQCRVAEPRAVCARTTHNAPGTCRCRTPSSDRCRLPDAGSNEWLEGGEVRQVLWVLTAVMIAVLVFVCWAATFDRHTRHRSNTTPSVTPPSDQPPPPYSPPPSYQELVLTCKQLEPPPPVESTDAESTRLTILTQS